MRNFTTIGSRTLQRCLTTKRSSSSRLTRHIYTLPPVRTIRCRFDQLEVADFKEKAFFPQLPLLITTRDDPTVCSSNLAEPDCSIPAATKWFETAGDPPKIKLSQKYLSQFGENVLPYELVTYPNIPARKLQIEQQDIRVVRHSPRSKDGGHSAIWTRFHAPLSLLLQAERIQDSREQLYIAQAQIADLPKELQNDLPTPTLAKCAAKGDIYDANIWIGFPPTYTPLHKDPNPNLFVQLASGKRIRLLKPTIGAAIFARAQLFLGQSSSSQIRGEEMMQGPERDALDEAIWGDQAVLGVFEAVVGPGDALFIPKGWWHSIKSIGSGINGSVNWWFR